MSAHPNNTPEHKIEWRARQETLISSFGSIRPGSLGTAWRTEESKKPYRNKAGMKRYKHERTMLRNSKGE